MNPKARTPDDEQRREDLHDGPDKEPGRHPAGTGRESQDGAGTPQRGPGSASADVGMTSDGRGSGKAP